MYVLLFILAFWCNVFCFNTIFFLWIYFLFPPSDPGCFGNNSIHERSYVSFCLFSKENNYSKIMILKLNLNKHITFYRVEDQQKSNGISDGLIIGVVLCILFILILAVALIVVYAYRRRKHSSEYILTVIFYITMHVPLYLLFSY